MSLQRTIRRNKGSLAEWISNSRAVGKATRKKLEKERKRKHG